MNSRTITLLGTIDNSGLIGPGTVGLNTFVVDSTTTGGGIHKVTTIGGTLTFTGGGRVELGDDIGSVVLIGTSFGGTIENVDNLISIAFGGISGLVLRNDAGATIDATGGGAITVEAGSTNDGVIRSTATAGVFFVSGVLANRGTIVSEGSSNAIDIEASVDNAGGTIEAGAAPVGLGLDEIYGGLLGGGDFFEVFATATLVGGATSLTAAATIEVNAGITLALAGAIGNQVLLQLGAGAELLAVGAVTLGGGGQVTLGGTGALIGGAGGTLENVDNHISGAGTIGAGTLALRNDAGATIEATGPLALAASTTNAGLIEVDAGDKLTVLGTVGGGGAIEANGGSVVFDGAVLAGQTVGATGPGGVGVTGATRFDGSAGTVALDRRAWLLAAGRRRALAGAIADRRPTLDVGADTLTVAGTGDAGRRRRAVAGRRPGGGWGNAR